jgi:methylmalonyl-CoA/ethylmalonyl-CoA epimerase
MIDTAPRPGAGGCRVAFVHPKGAMGVLTELSQHPPGGKGHGA